MKLPTSALLATVAIVSGIWIQALVTPAKNPPIVADRTIEAHIAVPGNVQSILGRACKNCHSFETHWPWYSHLPVVSGLVHRDVERARSHMNLSDWSAKLAQGDDEARATLSGICEELRSDAMPLPQYRWMHRESRLTETDVETVCRWTDRAMSASAAHPEQNSH